MWALLGHVRVGVCYELKFAESFIRIIKVLDNQASDKSRLNLLYHAGIQHYNYSSLDV